MADEDKLLKSLAAYLKSSTRVHRSHKRPRYAVGVERWSYQQQRWVTHECRLKMKDATTLVRLYQLDLEVSPKVVGRDTNYAWQFFALAEDHKTLQGNLRRYLCMLESHGFLMEARLAATLKKLEVDLKKNSR